MGPGSLFESLNGELVDIVDYAFDHHKKTGRPPKLAVNASSWWYANMTTATVQGIRDRAGIHVNPIESSILFYTLRILQLGIQLHFVFDGPKRLSNGGKLHPGYDPPSQLFEETLTQIGVPWHIAPAEAEAECAKMEIEEVVDGVWSEDGDALAFGCHTLIKFYREVVSSTERAEDIRKSSTYFKVYRLDDLARQYPGMDREGFILYAILNGRPNDVGELYNLGPQGVLNAAGRDLGKSLCAASNSKEELRKWAKTDFAAYLKDTGNDFEIPRKFPQWKHVQDYLNPVTSTPDLLSDLPPPSDPFLDEKKLFSFLDDKFQWTLKRWVKFVLPFRIVRSLLATQQGAESQHDSLKLECDLQKKKKTPKKAKATFLLCNATSLDTSALNQKNGELETPLWILRKANFNQQRSIASFLRTPDSNQKGKAVASASDSGPSSQRSDQGGNRAPLTPPSGSAPSSNGEGPSTTRDLDTSRRQSPPPSPTPTSRRRNLPWPRGARNRRNIQPAPQNARGTAVQTKEKDSGKGKGKEKEVLNSPRGSAKRARSPEDSEGSSSEAFETMQDKRPKLVAEQRPSTPPAQITPSTPPAQVMEPADAVRDYIMIDSDSDSDSDDFGSFPSAAAELPLTPLARITGPANVGNDFIMIDSDEDEFGSFPSVAGELTSMPQAQSTNPAGAGNSSSGDEYGSFPASPELRSLP